MSEQQGHTWSFAYILLLLQVYFIRIVVRLSKLEIVNSKQHSSQYLQKQFNVKKRLVEIPSRQAGRTIKLHLYTPNDDGFKAENRPAHVNWHGSGFDLIVMPLHGDDVHFCAFLSSTLRLTVIDADYRKSPEHPFPACIQDAEDVMLYVLSRNKAWKTDKITIGGFSAGGNMALGQASILSSRIRAVVAVYPPTDFRPTRQERIPPEVCKGALPNWLVVLFEKSYIIPKQDTADPLLSVILCKAQDYPRVVFVSTGRGDTLFNEGKALIEKAQSAQHADATFYPIQGVAHAWDKDATGIIAKKRDDLYRNISYAIKRSWT